MKKNRLLTALLTLLLTAMAQVGFAQANLEAPALDPELKVKADEIVGFMTADPDAANKEITKIMRRKKEEDLTALGRYFYDQNQLQLAKIIAQAAYQKKPSYLPALNLLGETYVKTGELGKAGQKFDELLALEPNEKSIMLKSVSIYKKVNPEVAKEILLKLKSIDPNDYEADRELASIYYATNDIPAAIKTYEAYFKAYPQGDPKSKQDYAVLLFLSGEFDKSLNVVDEALKTSPNEIALTRMKFFDLYELGRYNDAKAAMESHLTKYVDSLYNYSDYLYKGRLLDNLGDVPNAIAAYEKSIQLNPDNADTYESLSNAYKSANDYAKAIEAYKTFMVKKGDKAVIRDNLVFGRLYYSAAQDASADSTKASLKETYINDGIKQFKEVETRVPDNYLGAMWLARINILRNPEIPQDTVKAYYEKTLKLLEGKDNKSTKVECYNYFTFYAFHNNDYASARQYNAEALKIDPEDSLAQQIASALKGLK